MFSCPNCGKPNPHGFCSAWCEEEHHYTDRTPETKSESSKSDEEKNKPGKNLDNQKSCLHLGPVLTKLKTSMVRLTSEIVLSSGMAPITNALIWFLPTTWGYFVLRTL